MTGTYDRVANLGQLETGFDRLDVACRSLAEALHETSLVTPIEEMVDESPQQRTIFDHS